MKDFGTWPYYSQACRKDVDALLKKGGSLSDYRASSAFPDWKGPAKDSWAWRLEREIEKRFGVRHAVACNSGTAALHCALHALALPEGSEVVTTPYTFSGTVSAICLAGLRPVFADVDAYSFSITKETVARVFNKRTKAILPVHLFGGMADVRSLQSFGVPVVEDACQAVGARIGDEYSGTIGTAGCYSWNGGKNVPAGEGGAIVTNSRQVWESSRLLVNHGENFGSKQVGYNYRINAVTACIAWHGLVELEERNAKRMELAAQLDDVVSDCFREAPFHTGGSHVFYTYPIYLWVKSRPRFISRMKRRGYAVQAGYTQPLHTLPAFRKYQRCPLPVVEYVHKRLCLLNNVRPPSTVKDMQKMAQAMREALDA